MSYLANLIDEEYKRKKYYKEKVKRERCMEMDCDKCKYSSVCLNVEEEEI